MNFRPFLALILASSVLGLGGCKSLLKKKDADPAPSATVVASAPPAVIAPLATTPEVPAPVPSAVVDETTIPTSQDFEDEAFEKVTAANFRAQLTTLKTDISK